MAFAATNWAAVWAFEAKRSRFEAQAVTSCVGETNAAGNRLSETNRQRQGAEQALGATDNPSCSQARKYPVA